MGFLESACATLDSWNNPRHVPNFSPRCTLP